MAEPRKIPKDEWIPMVPTDHGDLDRPEPLYERDIRAEDEKTKKGEKPGG